MNTIRRKDLLIGMLVEIQSGNDVYRGYIQDIITKTNQAARIKVKLKTGESGYVIHLVTKEEMEMERFKYYNRFFYEQKIASIWDRKENKYFIKEEKHPTKPIVHRYAFLFTDQEIADDVLSSLKDDRYMLRWINRKRPIRDNFKTLDYSHYRINEERKITKKNLDEREHSYSNIAPSRSRKGRK